MKTRTRLLIILTSTFLLTTVIVVPRIIEAKRSKESSTDKSLSATTSFLPNTTIQGQKGDVTVGGSIRNDTSKPLREMKQLPIERKAEHEANENPKVPTKHKDSDDPVVQPFSLMNSIFDTNMPATLSNFDGIGYPGVACNCAPPDTDGEVGLTQYVQMVNEGFQVFDKTTGASVLGPSGITTLWSGFGGVCQNNGNGDPVVLYDQLANRWVISQFAGISVPTDECIAVSTTSDATGSYNRYDFHLGSNFFDYPHIGVWPDAYYMSMNVFNSSGTAFLGPQPFAFDRTKMLLGLPATFVTTGVTGGSGEEVYLPADLDGSIPPAVGAPATFVEFPGGGAYRLFHFHVDFGVPANSTFTLFASTPAAGFTTLCATTRSCVPQAGTTNKVDGIGDRLMFRLAYRNFGDHEAVVGNYTVSSGGVAGIRWFELRNVTSGPVTKFQESTYQPDATWRWMGSAAMDQQGNLAIGYSASSASINPQIRYSGRLFTDPVNTLTQAEGTMFAGAGSQTGTLTRWGDYSDLTVDPVDDCTFWYTNEYIPANGSFNWRTRIGSFKFPGCGGVPTPTPTPTPIPNAPTNLTATTVSSSQINLAWTDNATDETGFKIERCQNAGCSNFAEIATVGANVTTFSDTGLVASTSYSYRVRATNLGGDSAYSNTASATTQATQTAPAAPSNLTATAVSTSQINLSWSDNSSNETGFMIERCQGNGCTSFAQIAQVGANVTTFSNTGLAGNTRYRYRVRAFNAVGNSAYSNIAGDRTLR